MEYLCLMVISSELMLINGDMKKWLIWEYLWLMVINGGVLMANSELMVINLLVMTVTVCELEAMAQSKYLIYVDLPMKNGDFPWFFVCLHPTSRSVLKDANSITATIQEMWQGQLCERRYGGSRGKALEVTVLGGF